jgi:Ser/Thr protein kinase RdoA (MazF antagonist)
VIRYRLWWFEPKTGRTKHRSVIGKLYRAKDERGKQVFETMQALWKNGFGDAGEDAIRVPRPLGYLDEWRLLLMEDFAGTPLESLEPAATAAAIPTAGRALAKLHRCHLEVEQRFTTEQEVDLLRGWVRVASLVEPSMKAGFGKALAEVEESLDRCREFEPALVHRDFYDKQVVLNDSEAAVIDFDTLCRSDPAIDLGNFLAHLRLAGLKGMGNVRPLKERFLAAYGAASPDLLVHAHAYTRSSLLRLACLHSLWPQWSHLAGPLLQEVP